MSKVGRSKDPRRPRRVASERKAQMHFCSDAQMPRSVKTAPAVLTDRVPTTLRGSGAGEGFRDRISA